MLLFCKSSTKLAATGTMTCHPPAPPPACSSDSTRMFWSVAHGSVRAPRRARLFVGELTEVKTPSTASEASRDIMPWTLIRLRWTTARPSHCHSSVMSSRHRLKVMEPMLFVKLISGRAMTYSPIPRFIFRRAG